MWEFVRSNWEFLVDRYSINDRYLGRLPKYVSKTFSTEFRLNEMKEFFAKYPEAGAGKSFVLDLVPFVALIVYFNILTGKRARKQALENIENNISWLRRHQEAVYTWLVQNPTQ